MIRELETQNFLWEVSFFVRIGLVVEPPSSPPPPGGSWPPDSKERTKGYLIRLAVCFEIIIFEIIDRCGFEIDSFRLILTEGCCDLCYLSEN